MLCKKTWVVCVSVIGAALSGRAEETEKTKAVNSIEGQVWTDDLTTSAAGSVIGTGADAANAAVTIVPLNGQTNRNAYSIRFEWLTDAATAADRSTITYRFVIYPSQAVMLDSKFAAFNLGPPYGPQEVVLPHDAAPSEPKGTWLSEEWSLRESTVDLRSLKFQTVAGQVYYLGISFECSGPFFTAVMLGQNNSNGADPSWYMSKGSYGDLGPLPLTDPVFATTYGHTQFAGAEIWLFKPHRFDRDQDDDVDVDDLENGFRPCMNGPAMPLTPGCEWADVDNDGDVDQSDFGRFQVCYSGQGNSPDPTCVAQE